MKRWLLIFVLFFAAIVEAQITVEDQEPSSSYPLIPEPKQKLLKNVDIIFNSRFAFDAITNDGDFQDSKFSVQQLRLEIKGKIHDKVYFRFRDRYTSNTEPGAQDQLNRSTDYAYIGVDLSPKSQVNLGKMAMAWGGYEFCTGHVETLQFNDIIAYGDNFLTGASLTHQLNHHHSLGVQLLNSRVDSFEKTFSGKIPENIDPTKLPLAAVTNWKGNFFGGKFQTNYSYSFFQQAKNRDAYLIALGHQLKLKNFKLLYDFKYSHEDLDRKGLVTKMLSNHLLEDEPHFIAQDVAYQEHWLRADYQFHQKWSASLTLMSSDAFGKNTYDENSGNHHLRATFTVIPTLYFKPFKNLDLKFFAAYVERWYRFSDFGQNNLALENYNTGKLSIGFMAPILVF